MSEAHNIDSVEEVQSPDVQEKDYVSKKAYEEVSKDMHKFKSELKAAKAARAEYEAQLKTLEEQKMRENEQWKELSEKYKVEGETERAARLQDRAIYIDTVKKSALKSELGSNIKDTYLVHANIDAIEVNENGVIDRDSLLHVANEFRQEHGSLLGTTTGVTATSSAPSNQTLNSGQKSISDMSYDEKALELLRLKNLK